LVLEMIHRIHLPQSVTRSATLMRARSVGVLVTIARVHHILSVFIHLDGDVGHTPSRFSHGRSSIEYIKVRVLC